MKFKKFRQNAMLPTRQTAGACGYDLHSIGQHMVGAVAVIPTGVAVKIPDGHVGLIWDRSGHAAKHGLTTLAGVIDADFVGEISVVMTCTKGESKSIADGERVAQLVVVPCVMEASEWVDALEQTDRGAGSFGSTGQ